MVFSMAACAFKVFSWSHICTSISTNTAGTSTVAGRFILGATGPSMDETAVLDPISAVGTASSGGCSASPHRSKDLNSANRVSLLCRAASVSACVVNACRWPACGCPTADSSILLSQERCAGAVASSMVSVERKATFCPSRTAQVEHELRRVSSGRQRSVPVSTDHSFNNSSSWCRPEATALVGILKVRLLPSAAPLW